MEAYINQFPVSVSFDGRIAFFYIERGVNTWYVGYRGKGTIYPSIYKWSGNLYFAMKLMEAWLRKNNHWVEEEPNVDFSQLPS
jgi:hypothetical protein